MPVFSTGINVKAYSKEAVAYESASRPEIVPKQRIVEKRAVKPIKAERARQVKILEQQKRSLAILRRGSHDLRPRS